MCPRLQPALKRSRHPDPGRASKIDKVTQHPLLLFRGHSCCCRDQGGRCFAKTEYDIECRTLRLGFDCEGPENVGPVDLKIEAGIGCGADDARGGELVVGVEEVDFGVEFP